MTKTSPNPLPPVTPNPAAGNSPNNAVAADPARLAELERMLEEAKREIADSTARIERAFRHA
jgi:hypothetical protein